MTADGRQKGQTKPFHYLSPVVRRRSSELVESPGTAPGSERFITTPVYRHSRLAPAPGNIGAKGCRKKSKPKRPISPHRRIFGGGRTREVAG